MGVQGASPRRQAVVLWSELQDLALLAFRVNYEEPPDTDMCTTLRTDCKWPSKESSLRPVPCPVKCVFTAHWHMSRGSPLPQCEVLSASIPHCPPDRAALASFQI